MTETPRPPKTLTPTELTELRRIYRERNGEFKWGEELFDHIDALTAEVAALQDAVRQAQLMVLNQEFYGSVEDFAKTLRETLTLEPSR